MKRTCLPAAIVALVCAAPTAWGVDLAKIERTIAKEPVYQTKTPQYCLLVLGPEAKTHMWLVLDGKVLYVDRNGDGDLTGADKRVEINAKGNVFVTASLANSKIQFSHLVVRIKDMGRADIYLTRKVDDSHRKKGRDSLME